MDVEPVRVVERVTRLVAHVHHDLALVLEIVHRALELGELRIGQIEGDADHRLPVGTPPFVGQVADGLELLETLALQLAMELVYEALDRRAFELEPELVDLLLKQLDFGRGLADFGSGYFLEVAHPQGRGFQPRGRPSRSSRSAPRVGGSNLGA